MAINTEVAYWTMFKNRPVMVMVIETVYHVKSIDGEHTWILREGELFEDKQALANSLKEPCQPH